MWKYNLEIHWNMDYINDYLQMDFIITHNATLSEFILGCGKDTCLNYISQGKFQINTLQATIHRNKSYFGEARKFFEYYYILDI